MRPHNRQEPEITASYEKGDHVYMTNDAVKHYGEMLDGFTEKALRDRPFRVTHVATENGEPGGPEGTHPGFDPTAGCALYDLDGLPVSLYEWELT